jgi:hypothetical protein
MKRLIFILLLALSTIGYGAIARTQAVSANATSVTITAATAGDFIVVFAYNSASSTIPTLPAGFTNITSISSTDAARIYYKIATGGETSSGVATSATPSVCEVYRGAGSFGTTPTINAGSGLTLTYPAVTLLNASGSSWVIAFGGSRLASAGMNGTPTGTAPNLGNRTNQTLVNGLETGAGVTSVTAQTVIVTGSGLGKAVTIELQAPAVAGSTKGNFLMLWP